MTIRIVEGLDIPIGGAPEQTISPGPDVTSVALLGDDYHGLRHYVAHRCPGGI